MMHIDFAFSVRERCVVGGWVTGNQPNDADMAFSVDGVPCLPDIAHIFRRHDIESYLLLNNGTRTNAWSFFAQCPLAGSEIAVIVNGEDVKDLIDSKIRSNVCELIQKYSALSKSPIDPTFYQFPAGAIWSALSGTSTLLDAPEPDRDCVIHLDRAETGKDGILFLSGWVTAPADDEPGYLVLSTDGDTKMFHLQDIVTLYRGDVVSSFAESGIFCHSARGFSLVVDCPGGLSNVRLKCISAKGNVTEAQSVSLSKLRPMDVAAELFELRSRSRGPVAEFITRLVDVKYGDWLSAVPTSTEQYRSGPILAPKISFSIPLFKKWDFVKYHALMFEHLALELPPLEVIYVIDDPSIEDDILNWCRNSSPPSNYSRRILCMGGNYGFARASNEGMRAARGDYTLFMNSDVYIRNVAGISAALTQIEDRDDMGLVGFTLLYEDGTVQHDGIKFVELPDFFGFEMPDHPGRGWGANSQVLAMNELHESRYLTGALLLGPTAYLKEIGGFPEHYVIGDFEDIELCDVVASTRKIYLCKCDGIFHLERQSMAAVDTLARRMAVLVRNRMKYEQTRTV